MGVNPKGILEGVAAGPQGEPGSPRQAAVRARCPNRLWNSRLWEKAGRLEVFSGSLPGGLGSGSLTAPQGNGGGGGPPNPARLFLLENRTRSWVGAEEGCGVTLQDSQMDGWRGVGA